MQRRHRLQLNKITKDKRRESEEYSLGCRLFFLFMTENENKEE